MRYSKGKYVFSNKEVYGVEVTLNKVILGYLQKLHDSLSKSVCHGVPMRYLEQQAKREYQYQLPVPSQQSKQPFPTPVLRYQ